MKKIISLFFSAALACTTAFSAFAEFELPTVDDTTKEQISLCLDGRFEGCDIDSACEVYGFDLPTLCSTGSLKDSLDRETPFYIVSYENGEVYLSYDESGALAVTDSFEYDASRDKSAARYNFSSCDVEAALSGFENVSGITYYQDGWNGLDLVSFTSDNEEYAVPFFTLSDKDLTKLNGKVYKLSEFISLFDDTLSYKDSPDLAGGGEVNVQSPEPTKLKNDSVKDAGGQKDSITAVVFTASLLIISAAVVTALMLKKKS